MAGRIGNHKVYGRNRSVVLFILQNLLAVLAAACVTILVIGSSVQVSFMKSTESYMVTPWNVNSKDYEESFIFHDILLTNIEDVARMAVIKSQLETDGAYNGKKIVDVVPYVHRARGGAPHAISARFYLEDLLKWEKFGFEYQEILVDESTFYGKAAPSEGETAHNVYRSVLDCRYQTVDGHSLEELVSDYDEYIMLCNYVEEAAANLYYNYQEYYQYSGYFDTNITNFRYSITMHIHGEDLYFSNIEQENMTDSEMTEQFKKYGKYVYYNPATLSYDTNTHIYEEEIRQTLHHYEYAYPETTKVWFGVDTTYPVEDAYTQAVVTYHKILPYWWYLVIVAICAIFLYIVLLVLISVYQGNEYYYTEDGIVERRYVRAIDKIPTELWIVMCYFVFVGIGYFGAYYLYEFTQNNVQIKNELFVLILIYIGIFSVFSLTCYYSLIRRIKSKTLWHNSIIVRFLGWIGKSFSGFFSFFSNKLFKVFDHLTTLLRVLLPAAFIFVINVFGCFLLFGCKSQLGAVILFFAFVIDGCAVMYQMKAGLERERIKKGIEQIRGGDLEFQIKTENMHGENLVLAQAVNSIGDGIREAVSKSMKDERLKTDLITNVSHDLKTPLTSIINYVNLIKREQIENEAIKNYVDILDAKSQRLKNLTEDLVEASKISSGNVSLQFAKINFVELINQTIGEFSEKFEEKGLQVVATYEKPVYIEADSRRIWRVVENLFQNIYKYAMENTRVYIDIFLVENKEEPEKMLVEADIKNISKQSLNIDAEQLTERFIRGDVSRSTEGSGLGLSIAKDLVKLQNGTMNIYLDGDLFKVTLKFPSIEKNERN